MRQPIYKNESTDLFLFSKLQIGWPLIHVGFVWKCIVKHISYFVIIVNKFILDYENSFDESIFLFEYLVHVRTQYSVFYFLPNPGERKKDMIRIRNTGKK